MTSSHDGWIEMTELDIELERLLGGAAPSAQAPAWCSDVALLVRAATAPARPDELEREDEIVSRMRELRLAALADALIEEEVVTTDTAEAGADDRAGDEADHAPALVATAGSPSRDEDDGSLSRDDHDDPADRDEDDEAPVAAGEQAEETGPDPDGGARTGAYRDAGPAVVDLRTPWSAVVHDLDDYRAKHGGERYYRAKHAAARLEASKYPLARTVGRVVAIKAVAVATAVAVAAAAAAATTGIVATVVVPALTAPDRHPTTVEATTTTGESGTGTTAQRSHSGGTGGRRAAPACASLLPACLPLPTALAAPVPPEVAKKAADLIAKTEATTGPKTAPTPETTTTSMAPTETTTTSTTVPEPPPTTEPEPPPTTTPPTTEPPPSDPGTMSTQSTGGGDAPGGE